MTAPADFLSDPYDEDPCEICVNPLGFSREWQLWSYQNFSTLHHGSIAKHTGCGPILKCGYCLKELNEASGTLTELPVDLHIGWSELHDRSVFLNYCRRRCAIRDDGHLWAVYDELYVDNEDEEGYRPDIMQVVTTNGKIPILLGYIPERNANDAGE